MSVVTITAIIGQIKFMFSIKVWPIEIRKRAAIYWMLLSLLAGIFFVDAIIKGGIRSFVLILHLKAVISFIH